MTAPCAECGGKFHPDGSWQRLCWPCWRARRNDADEVYRRGYAVGYRRGYEAGHAAGFWDGSKPSTSVDRELLRDLVQPCHPDRHPSERAELANRVTGKLRAGDRRAA